MLTKKDVVLSIETKKTQILELLQLLRVATKKLPAPASVIVVERYGRDPYLLLVACLLSLRAKDTASLPAAESLFALAKTPHQLIQLPLLKIEQVIYSVGFYRNKAKCLQAVSKELIDRFDGKVPQEYDQLISIKGIGPKTANLILSEAFGKQALYVDVHVHRISNRLGIISTKTVEETQEALERIVPKRYWSEYSRLLVTWGQNICGPVSPLCSMCPIYKLCQRIGVIRHR